MEMRRGDGVAVSFLVEHQHLFVIMMNLLRNTQTTSPMMNGYFTQIDSNYRYRGYTVYLIPHEISDTLHW